jgi:Uncharacterized protein conserved in bacteria
MSIFDLLPENKKEQPLMFGVTVAKVTNTKDPEKIGRIKCKFLMRDTEEETDWIRIASPLGGKECGVFFLPEVDDEVLLAFAGGEISSPYVIGCLWNKTNKPPSKDEGELNIFRGIKSKNGSKIAFENAKEKTNEKVYIHTLDGERELLFDESKKTVLLHDKGDADIIKIDSNAGEITIKGKSKVSIEVGGNKIVIDSSSIKVESSSSITLKAPQITLDASGSLEMKCTAITKISGSMVNING